MQPEHRHLYNHRWANHDPTGGSGCKFEFLMDSDKSLSWYALLSNYEFQLHIKSNGKDLIEGSEYPSI